MKKEIQDLMDEFIEEYIYLGGQLSSQIDWINHNVKDVKILYHINILNELYLTRIELLENILKLYASFKNEKARFKYIN